MDVGLLAGRSRLVAALTALAVLALGAIAYVEIRDHQLADQLLVTDPDELPAHPELVQFAASRARPAYASNCAGCHGADMRGGKGVPNLVDQIWLYDFGRVSDIERTILYGIRSGNAKGRNITDMPALGIERKLTPAEITDTVVFVRSLTQPGGDPAAIERGYKLFEDKGVCYDCHSSAADGNPDYGSTSFKAGAWLYGGDAETVYRSVYYGRHGRCPAWIGKLSFTEIRALALYIHTLAQPSHD